MKESKAFLLLAVVCAVLIIGVAYAAITNLDFTITGNATAVPTNDNFVVALGKINETDAPTFTGSTGANVTFTTPTDRTATMNVTGLTKVNDYVTATFTVINKSTDLKAQLVLATGKSNVNTSATSDYFDIVVSDFVDTVIDAEGKTTFTVTVTLKKLPISANETVNIGVAFEAKAVEL